MRAFDFFETFVFDEYTSLHQANFNNTDLSLTIIPTYLQ